MEKDSLKPIINNNFHQKLDSSNFTHKVMERIALESESKQEIKPLIPRKVLWVIALCYSSLFLLPLIFQWEQSSFPFLDGIEFGSVNISDFLDEIQFGFNLLFIFSLLTLGDLLLKARKWV